MNEAVVTSDFHRDLRELRQELAHYPQTDCPLIHRFAPGVYLREIHMPADTAVIGKIHRTEHFNILLKGRCIMINEDGSRLELRAPLTFVSKAGVQKVLYIIEETLWQTVHVTRETDMVKLEAELIEPFQPEISVTMHNLIGEVASSAKAG